jgi:cysteine desulfurase
MQLIITNKSKPSSLLLLSHLSSSSSSSTIIKMKHFRFLSSLTTTTTASSSLPSTSSSFPTTTNNIINNKFKKVVQNNSLNIIGEALPGRPAYLDLQATTPMDPRVLDAMLPFQISEFGNPHSRTHAYGWAAEAAVEEARAKIAHLIGAEPKEIIFTSGATESNNLAIKGSARFVGAAAAAANTTSNEKKHIITTQTEHKCVLDSCRQLEREGFEVTYLGVKNDGLVDLEQLEKSIKPDRTILVSVMGVNNEIGVVQPLQEIGAICKKYDVTFHTDAAQMAGKLPLDVKKMNIGLMSLSGHKIYGPKGIGALYVRRRPRVRLEPIISGGGQERGLRSGTLAPFLCVGLGEACAIAEREMKNDHEWVSYLSKRLSDGIKEKLPHVTLNGHPSHRYPGNLNFSFAYVEGESLLMALKNIAVSSGSACTSASLEPSYVLRAIGVGEDLAHTSIRFGLGRFNTREEVDFAIDACVRHVNRLREMSPLWEMVQEGIDITKIQWASH